MLQHLDDPVPLPSASAHQRRAVMERGAALRRRRWALIAGIPTVAAVVTALAVGLPALPEGPAYDRTAAPAAPPARPSASAEPADPVTGSVVFGGAEEVSATVSLPPGWVTEEVFVLRSGADPKPGVAFFDVANIYADGCRWVPLQPPVGPTVDDLVQAFASLPGFGGEVRDVTVDGYQGKQIEHTVPDYDQAACRNGRFGLFLEDSQLGQGDAPNLWAQTPEQRNEIRILDVDGTRLVILSGHPAGRSAQDLADLRSILASVQIG
jgi:hypothetical protein